MVKFAVILVLVITGLIYFSSDIFRQFAIWDASNPNDDKQQLQLLLYRVTPNVTASNLYQNTGLRGGQVIDVRSREEFEEKHLTGAIHIPEETLYQEIPKKFPNKSELIYLYCDTGHRGATATRLLRSMGYEKSFNLEGGLNVWEKFGYPVVRAYPAYF